MDEPKSLFDEIDDNEKQALDEAEADVVADRLVPHEEVVEWLKSWGTADELPAPAPKSK